MAVLDPPKPLSPADNVAENRTGTKFLGFYGRWRYTVHSKPQNRRIEA